MRLEKIVAVLPGAVVTESGVKRALGDKRWTVGEFCWCDGSFVFGHEVASGRAIGTFVRRQRYILALVKTTDGLHYIVKINTATLEIIGCVPLNISNNYYMQYFCYNDKAAYIINFDYAEIPEDINGYEAVFDVYKISANGALERFNCSLGEYCYNIDTIDARVADNGDLILGVVYTRVKENSNDLPRVNAVQFINSVKIDAPNASFLHNLTSMANDLIAAHKSELSIISKDDIEIQDNPSGDVQPLEHETGCSLNDGSCSMGIFAGNVFSGEYIYHVFLWASCNLMALVRSEDSDKDGNADVERAAEGTVLRTTIKYISNFAAEHTALDDLIFMDHFSGYHEYGDWMDFPGVPYQKVDKQTGQVIGQWSPQWRLVSGPTLFRYQDTSRKNYFITREYPQGVRLHVRAAIVYEGYFTDICDWCILDVGGKQYDVTDAFYRGEPWSAAGREEAPAACGVDATAGNAFIYDGAWINWFNREKSKSIVVVDLESGEKTNIFAMPNVATIANTVFHVLDDDDVFNSICSALAQ